ncbi:hypothetical protein [Nonomuraea soli]|uniref:Uncharacterized protein n=1 Tax=Nonomuraea soli TaxID=1032476 RepID=A0A7W0CUV3_9ACTN|nr:hypothetical protein [Nonomuraea soli]MBA2897763.1 hypothetical protein [Nonomuraea soli]
MRITNWSADGEARSFTVEYSASSDDPSGLVSRLAESGDLGRVLRELGHGHLAGHVPGSAEEFRRVFSTLGPVVEALDARRRVLMTAARHGDPGEFSWRGLAADVALAPTTVKRWVRAQEEGLQVGENEALVLLTMGDEALVVTARHSVQEPLRMPAARIAQQAGLPVGELAGRRFRVGTVSDATVDGFELLDDPRA